ncbi:hypothetical protein [Bradyrhizobium sp. UNPA324]|uniref:hypothetical protein n=1 Tax=Bradyrhizobium sp. UNPA324 TaxID=1141174 RepID=UPI0015EEB19B|nr:hypothetical protein [Bradyrhizobium sp. UNPA324]
MTLVVYVCVADADAFEFAGNDLEDEGEFVLGGVDRAFGRHLLRDALDHSYIAGSGKHD